MMNGANVSYTCPNTDTKPLYNNYCDLTPWQWHDYLSIFLDTKVILLASGFHHFWEFIFTNIFYFLQLVSVLSYLD